MEIMPWVIAQATLEKHGLRGEQLELEITESLLLHSAIDTLHRLKALGVRIALDDFGTGFSSLSYLKRLPIHKIKIDRSFIQEIATDPHDAVLDTACAHLRQLGEQGITGISMAVNISPMHFQRGNFVQCVQATLEKHGLSGEQLELEITESLLFHNAEQAIETLHRLKMLGVRIALDDFGTGFSSLSYLKRLPIDKIKIDRSFIQEITTDNHDAAITQGIISMAHHLSLTVVAEGVETASQVDFLKGSRCDIFQGYYFAKPMPYAEIEAFLSHPASLP